MKGCEYGPWLLLNIYSVTYQRAQLASVPASLIKYNTLAYWVRKLWKMKGCEYGSWLQLNIYSVTYHWAQLASVPASLSSLIKYNTLAYWVHS